MANNKIGLSFYRVDTDRYMDIRIKRLKKTFGCQGIAVYDYVLCEIYRVKGCFVEWDESTAFDVAEYFGIKENTVSEIVKYCAHVGLFDKELLTHGIVTSASIQRRFLTMSARANRKETKIPSEVNLLQDNTGVQKQCSHETPETKTKGRKEEPTNLVDTEKTRFDISKLAAIVPEDEYWEAVRLSAWGSPDNFATSAIVHWIDMYNKGRADHFYILIQSLQRLEERGQIKPQTDNRFLWKAQVCVYSSRGIFNENEKNDLLKLSKSQSDSFIAAINEWQKNKDKIKTPYRFIKAKLK